MSAQILIVEDNPYTRDLYQSILEGMGDFRISALGRADEAVNYLRKGGSSDVVITDMDMPGGSGLDVLEQARESLPAAPCMVCTAGLGEFQRKELQALGVRDILRKPFTVNEFRERVMGLLRSRRTTSPQTSVG